MRVRMEMTMAGPTGTFLAGQVADLPDAEAKRLLAAGYAKPVAAAKKPAETAALDPAGENAVEGQPGPRRRGRPSKHERRGGLDAADSHGST